MKASAISAAALLFGSAAAIPTVVPRTDGVDYTKIKYPSGTGENLPSYPAPPGGYENVKYPAGTGANLPSYPGAGGSNADCKPGQKFTSTYHVVALGKNVVNGTAPNVKSTPGPEDAVGLFDYQINSDEELICWNIVLVNFRGQYKSPAKTATHIHEAVAGANGSPRIAFPNPEGDDRVRRGSGCMNGPFTTGLMAMGKDTGAGFSLKQIEANPAGFFTDSHSEFFVPGVVRGQLA
jgi:hypothetical protein